MLVWLWNTILAVGASFFAGLLLRFNSQLSPDPAEFQRFHHVLFSHQIAHRGGSLDAPENTMCAFRNAAEHGVKVIEIDIQYTADGVPILLHDLTLDRTTSGSGPVALATLEELKAHSANKGFPDYIGECTVPTLEETVEFAIENDIILLFDVKGGGDYCDKVSRTISEILEKYPNFRHKFAVISFFLDILYRVRRDHPTVITGFTRRHDHIQKEARLAGYTAFYWQKLMFLGDRVFDFVAFYLFVPWMKINMLQIRKEDVSEEYVKDCAPRPITVWTVNDPLEKQYFKHLGCAVMSDRISD